MPNHNPSLEVTGLYRINKERIWQAEPLAAVELTREGIEGDRHFGATRVISGYESKDITGGQALTGVVVNNDKPLSFVSEADMLAIAEGLELPIDAMVERMELETADLMARMFAANALLKILGTNLNELLAPGSLIVLDKDVPNKDSTIIRATEYNEQCKKPFSNLLAALERLGLKPTTDFQVMYDQYKRVAEGKRGWVASVHNPGKLAIGQRGWVYSAKAPPKEASK
jgi:hypothetical protein